MEPRKEEPKETPEHRKEERKSRFQIVKLEERIAPAKGGIPGKPGEHCNRFGCGRG
jgi:hypothetical protein